MLMLAATQVGCEDLTRSQGTIGKSTQTVLIGGVQATNSNGGVVVEGLPATMSLVKLRISRAVLRQSKGAAEEIPPRFFPLRFVIRILGTPGRSLRLSSARPMRIILAGRENIFPSRLVYLLKTHSRR